MRDNGAWLELAAAPEAAARFHVYDARLNATLDAGLAALVDRDAMATLRDTDSRTAKLWLDDLEANSFCTSIVVVVVVVVVVVRSLLYSYSCL
jgi:hypothetical protein